MVAIKTKEELNQIIVTNSDKLVVLKFSAVWCSPCRMMGNVIREIEPTLENVVFVECDTGDADELVNEYKVRSIPTLVYFMGGYHIDTTIGSMSRGDLLKKIKENLNK